MQDCNDYMSVTGCGWTEKFSCPGQEAGERGAAVDDGSHGYSCCCARGLWKQELTAPMRSSAHLPGRALLEQQATITEEVGAEDEGSTINVGIRPGIMDPSRSSGVGLSVQERIDRRSD